MKNMYEINTRNCEIRWKNAMANKNAAEAYTAAAEYRYWYKAYESTFSKCPYGWPESEKEQKVIEDMGDTVFNMDHRNRLEFSDNQKRYSYEALQSKNVQLRSEMNKYVQNGNVEKYEEVRAQYCRNVEAMDVVGEQIEREQGRTDYRTNTYAEMNELNTYDYQMRDKLNEKIQNAVNKGKEPSEKLCAERDKYAAKVESNEKALLDYQAMRRGETLRKNVSFKR